METTNPQEPLITVVIACFNQEKELGLTLKSFLQQDFCHKEYEILVIDDHSPGTGARGVVAASRKQYPGATIEYIRHYRPDGGRYGASSRVKNIGLRLARGKIVYFNNSEILQAGQTLTYIANKQKNSDTPLCLRGRVIDLPYETLDGLTQAERDELHDNTDLKRERVASADHAGLAAVPRDILLQVGGNDERFDYWGKEDLDLAARLKRTGVTYLYDINLKSFHIYHPPNHVKEGDYLRMCTLLEENNRQELREANRGKVWGSRTPVPDTLLAGTVILDAGSDPAALKKRLERLIYTNTGEDFDTLAICSAGNRTAVEAVLERYFRTIELIVLPDQPAPGLSERILTRVRSKRVAFVPAEFEPAAPDWNALPADIDSISPWVEGVGYPPETARRHRFTVGSWIGGRECARFYLSEATTLKEWHLLPLVTRSGNRQEHYLPSYSTVPPASSHLRAIKEHRPTAPDRNRGPALLTTRSRIMAIIPHLACEEWLPRCLDSLARQTRKVDAVVVVDDASDHPPKEIVAEFPGITLLQTAENVGPYRIIQQVIDHSEFDGYMFQDADDWSAVDRLERLLAEAERSGAELVGSSELRVYREQGQLLPMCFPLDVNRALSKNPGHALIHPTSLVSRQLVKRVGGYATGLKFGGDTEFLYRAIHKGDVVNIPHFCYFHSHRPDSLTTHPETGLESTARKQLSEEVKRRARENTERIAGGQAPQLEPLSTRPEVAWKHIAGPPFPGRL